MKTKELKNKTETDLKKLLAEKMEAFKAFRFGISGSKVRNMKEGKNLKKDVAKILTQLNGLK